MRCVTAASDGVSSRLCRAMVMSASNDKNVVPLSKYKPTQLPILTTLSVYTGWLNMIMTFSHKACILTEHVFPEQGFPVFGREMGRSCCSPLTNCHFAAFQR